MISLEVQERVKNHQPRPSFSKVPGAESSRSGNPLISKQFLEDLQSILIA